MKNVTGYRRRMPRGRKENALVGEYGRRISSEWAEHRTVLVNEIEGPVVSGRTLLRLPVRKTELTESIVWERRYPAVKSGCGILFGWSGLN